MNVDEINALAAEYNAVELEQAERLKRLFYAIKGRQGRRYVRAGTQYLFNPGGWENPDRFDSFPRAFITEIVSGEESNEPRPPEPPRQRPQMAGRNIFGIE